MPGSDAAFRLEGKVWFMDSTVANRRANPKAGYVNYRSDSWPARDHKRLHGAASVRSATRLTGVRIRRCTGSRPARRMAQQLGVNQAGEIDMKERRAVVRHKSLLQGRIYLNHRRSSIDCTIREATRSGGRLKCSELAALPDAFEIYVPSRDQYFQAKAVWHKGKYVGVIWETEDILDPAAATCRSADPLSDRVAKLEHDVATLRKRLNALRD